MLQCRRSTLIHDVATVALLFLLGSAVTGLAGCERVTRENYDRVQLGMPMQQVKQLLGEPDQITSGGAEVMGFGGTAANMVWRSGNKSITVTFVNDKVVKKGMSNL